MIRLPTREGKLAPAYQGPYTVLRKTQGETYSKSSIVLKTLESPREIDFS